ncbi:MULTISPECIES: hypothetical protein [unclassified Butyrivibrio]|uniref:hypothetical protein n=1 Tax=unclassified Butyrivibrio TaxID=2639466 RepID=UPI0004204072|nr:MULTISPECIES: hypothetical protein [unclassified Butyrivibrio]
MSLQESGEMYLETIHVLSKKSANVRAVDIGEELGYSRPSVSRAMHILKAEGFITIDDTGFVKLTKAGQKIASRIYERHTVLTRLFINLGVNEKTASYGSGDGQWMRDWQDRLVAAGASIIGGEGVIANNAPDDDAVSQCEDLGRQLAQA